MKDLKKKINYGNEIIPEDLKKLVKPVTDTKKNASEDVTKSMTETFKEDYEAKANPNKKVSELMKDRGTRATYFVSPLINDVKLENKIELKLVKDPN